MNALQIRQGQDGNGRRVQWDDYSKINVDICVHIWLVESSPSNYCIVFNDWVNRVHSDRGNRCEMCNAPNESPNGVKRPVLVVIRRNTKRGLGMRHEKVCRIPTVIRLECPVTDFARQPEA